MHEIARSARVSEATAYRYFPDPIELLREAIEDLWPEPSRALGALAASTDVVERIGRAAEVFMRAVLSYQGAVRAITSATITRPAVAAGHRRRLELIDFALEPLNPGLAVDRPDVVAQLKRELAVVISAETLFTLIDLCGSEPEEAIATAVRTTRTLTGAASAVIRG